jgi:preprotein translocase subunit SecF
MVVAALFFLGGEVIHGFSFAMLIGLVIGAYSTIYVCSPLVFEWELRKQQRNKAMFKGKK